MIIVYRKQDKINIKNFNKIKIYQILLQNFYNKRNKQVMLKD